MKKFENNIMKEDWKWINQRNLGLKSMNTFIKSKHVNDFVVKNMNSMYPICLDSSHINKKFKILDYLNN